MAPPLGPGGIEPVGNARDKGQPPVLSLLLAELMYSNQHWTIQTFQTRLWTRTIISSGCSITNSVKDPSITTIEVMGSQAICKVSCLEYYRSESTNQGSRWKGGSWTASYVCCYLD
jgi:hypothetical protein